MDKKYFYIFLTRDGTTTLPDKDNEDAIIENMQYLGDLESNDDAIEKVIDEFYQNNSYLTKDYKFNDLIVKRFNNQVKTY